MLTFRRWTWVEGCVFGAATTMALGCGSAFEGAPTSAGQGGVASSTTSGSGGHAGAGGTTTTTTGAGGHGGATTGAGGAGGSGGTTTTGTGGTGGHGNGGSGGAGGAGGAGGCEPGTIEVCYSGPAGTEGVGVCVGGQRLCDVQRQFGACLGEVKASAETCNGKDDDCNGKTDELPDVTCGLGECRVTVPGCTNGAATPCIPKSPQAFEICDGVKDENCNGSVDEGCACTNGDTKSCYSGPNGTLGVGVCKQGVQTCAGGQWGACAGEVTPSAEVCDGDDDDCDKVVDNGNPGGGVACSTNLFGVCAAGLTVCLGGAVTCAQLVQPSAEQCNGADDDCDGQVDDGNPGGGVACDSGKLGVCAAGTTACVAGAIACQQNAAPSPESCNGADDDCNGKVDDGNPGGGAVCTTGLLGVCSAGTMACTGGAVSCAQSVQSSPELCNSLDDDCNGKVDDGNPEGGGLCITNGGKGVCAIGSITCLGGKLPCLKAIPSSVETCNGLDDDCNGVVDDAAVPPGTCPLPALCGTGVWACKGGALVCKAAAVEICGNGVDDDCDGVVDQLVYFQEAFASNAAGWTLGPEWQIAPAKASSGQAIGNPDPALDHTPTADNGVAGVVVGGNASAKMHAFEYLTSPPIDTTGKGLVFLEYSRFLNSDDVPFMTDTVEVYDGAKWVVIWSSQQSVPLADTQWTRMTHGITAYRNAAMRVRFGVSVQMAGSNVASSWNLDDVLVSSGPCP